MDSIPRYKGKSNIVTIIVYFSCLYFCLYYLNELFTNRFSTYFELRKSESAFPSLSICISLEDTRILDFCSSNLTSIQTKTENFDGLNFDACSNYSELVRFYSDNCTIRNPKEILEKAREYELNRAFTIKAYDHKFDSYFLNSGHLCIKFNFLNSTDFSIYNNYKLTNKIFLHQTLYVYDYNHYFHLQTCKAFESCEEFKMDFMQFFYKSTLPPYGSNCKDYLNAKLKFQKFEIIDHETICYQECMKQIIRPMNYFYSAKDNDYLNQKLGFDRSRLGKIKDKIDECRKECGVSECNQVRYLSYKKMHPGNHSCYSLNQYGFTNQEKPFLNTFEFYLQVVGFIFLLFSLSLNLLLEKLSLLINLNFNFRLYKPVFIMQYFIYFLACSCVHSKAFSLLIDYKNEIPQATFTFGGKFEYQDFSVHICFPLSLVLNRTDDNSNLTTIAKDTDELLKNFTLKHLNERSLPPQEFIKKIYYNYYYKLNENQLDVKKPFSFAFIISNYSHFKIYSKCFTYKVHKLDEPNYRNLQQESRFIVESKTKFFSRFVTEYSKTLTSKDNQQFLGLNVDKSVELINPKDIACEFYERTELNCDSYHNCLSNCIISRFGKQFGKIPFSLVLDEKMYVKYQDLKLDLNYTDKLDSLENECKKNLKPDCKQSTYVPERLIVPDLGETDEKVWKILPHFTVITTRISRLNDRLTQIINISTMYSIIMGFSFPIFLKTWKLFAWKIFQTYSCLRTKKKVEKFFDDHKGLFKYLKNLRLLVAWAFFVYFFRIVYKDSVESLVTSSMIQHNLHSVPFPVVGFCLKFIPRRFTIVNNLNGYNLEEMSRNITVDKIFDRIYYIDQDFKSQIWKSGDELSKNLRVKINYYRKRKCFDFYYKINVRDYSLNKFNYGLRIKLKDNLPFDNLVYYTKSNSDHVIFRYHTLKLDKFYLIFFDNYKLIINDIYQGFRNPLYWFLKPIKVKNGIYLTNLRKEFERVKNYTTLLLPLNENSYHYTIRNDLFEKYCEEEVKQKERYVTDNNAEVDLYRDFISETYNDTYTFTFSKRIFVAHQKIESIHTYVNFFTNILNLICFWFNTNTVCVLNRLVLTCGHRFMAIYNRLRKMHEVK